jgi:membrane protease YdiL (CAAX protease family)
MRIRSSLSKPWQRVSLFVILTYAISAPFEYLAIRAGNMGAAGGLYALGGMWSPGIAALIMKAIYRKEIGPLGWGWGKWRYQVWSFLIPFLSALVAYGLVWILGLGDLIPDQVAPRLARFAVMFGITLVAALGEEIGWQGYMIPELAKAYGFTTAGITRGVVWSVWHYPMIIAGIYSNPTPVWYNLVCFTILLTADSFVFAWFRLKSGSLWTGAIMHASHNGFIQAVFNRITLATGLTAYLTGEFGAATALVAVVVAVYFWRRRSELPPEMLPNR